MPLKLTLPNLDEVAEPLRAAYRPRTDGEGFVLDVEGGVVAKSVHDEFRTTNVQLRQKLEAFGDLTAEQVQTLRGSVDTLRSDLEQARKGRDADTETRFKTLTDDHARVVADHARAVEGLAKERDGYRSRLELVLIDGEVARVAAEAGAHPTALEDIATRLRPRFRLGEDNKAHAVDAQGGQVYGEDGQPLGVAGAVRQLIRSAPHLFKSSSGGGATSSSAGGGRSTAANPFAKDSWNVTEQMKLLKADKAEATRLAAEAGQRL